MFRVHLESVLKLDNDFVRLNVKRCGGIKGQEIPNTFRILVFNLSREWGCCLHEVLGPEGVGELSHQEMKFNIFNVEVDDTGGGVVDLVWIVRDIVDSHDGSVGHGLILVAEVNVPEINLVVCDAGVFVEEESSIDELGVIIVNRSFLTWTDDTSDFNSEFATALSLEASCSINYDCMWLSSV